MEELSIFIRRPDDHVAAEGDESRVNTGSNVVGSGVGLGGSYSCSIRVREQASSRVGGEDHVSTTSHQMTLIELGNV